MAKSRCGFSENIFINRRLLSEPPVGLERSSYQMEMSIAACDPEKERSRKILQPENDWLQDLQNVALARVLFAESTFFDKKRYQARVDINS